MQGSGEMQLVIRELSKTYANGVRALDKVSLTIDPGLYGLLGPNGAGKTTLMNTLATLQRPDSGSIMLGEIDALQDSTAIRRCLGYLPQEFGVYAGMSAIELLDYIAQLKGITDVRQRRRHVQELLEMVNLTKAATRSVDSYSGGMRQRFGIAQALIGSPALVIVDEPTAGLDPAERTRFHQILSNIAEGTIVLLSTHIVEDIANLCSRVAVMNDGRVAIEGTPRELAASLEGQLWTIPLKRGQMDELRRRYTVISERFQDGTLWATVKMDRRPEQGFVPKEPDLEDAYFSAVPAGS
jgi:ABC-2 type transport system ATP-binding protein